MSSKNRLFIYEKKEILILSLIGVAVAGFTFTLGVHLGKKLFPAKITDAANPGNVEPAHTQGDTSPTKLDLVEAARTTDTVADDAAKKNLQEEVEATQLKLDKPIPIDLPKSKTAATPEPKIDVQSGTEPKAEAKGEPLVVSSIEKAPAPSSKPKAEAHSEPKHQPENQTHTEAAPPSHTLPQEAAFTIQIGSLPTLQEAQKQISALKSASPELDPQVTEVDVAGKGKRYRLYVGAYSDRKTAQAAGQKLVKAGKIESFVVVKP
jgi:cell division protein FtsN